MRRRSKRSSNYYLDRDGYWINQRGVLYRDRFGRRYVKEDNSGLIGCYITLGGSTSTHQFGFERSGFRETNQNDRQSQGGNLVPTRPQQQSNQSLPTEFVQGFLQMQYFNNLQNQQLLFIQNQINNCLGQLDQNDGRRTFLERQITENQQRIIELQNQLQVAQQVVNIPSPNTPGN